MNAAQRAGAARPRAYPGSPRAKPPSHTPAPAPLRVACRDVTLPDMSRRVYITGLGPISGLGIGIEPTWEAVCAGRSAIGPISAFDPAGFDCRIAAQVPDYKIGDYVPKSYRKATKVMARDIELAVIGAERAARDAGLATKGTAADAVPSYEPARMGCHVGSGLIAADLDELTAALAEGTDEAGNFDIHAWGNRGMNHLTPLWLLKYLPNMLACHVTIIHDAQGPSNTITCGEASSGLSIGESLRVIQRNAADLCFCGGTESKLNPMAYLRQQIVGRLTPAKANDQPATALRPFDTDAAGTVVGEGGGIVILEAADTFDARQPRGGRAYAEVAGFGASQSVHRESRNLEPDPKGRGTAGAIRAALREANIEPAEVDLVVPFGSGIAAWDRAELAALRQVFGDHLNRLHLAPLKPLGGNCGAGGGGLETAIAAKALAEQTVPPAINRDVPLDGVPAGASTAQSAELRHALVYSSGYAGQNTALVLRRVPS